MSLLLIQGGRPLHGQIRVHGAKNSVLPILAATIINGSKNVIHNCPRLSDVDASIEILRHLGCTAVRQGSTLTIDSSNMSRYDIPNHLMREMRSSVIFLGAILARTGQVVMSFPGGCELGPRPIDLHLDALRQLGAEIQHLDGKIICKASHLHGREINLSFPSVGATENIMLAACACDGVVTVTNAACEPEIEDLQNFLTSIGVTVHGLGASNMEIIAKKRYHESVHTIIGDRIVASTYLCAAAAAGGDISISHVNPKHFTTVLSVLKQAGCEIESQENGVSLIGRKPLSAMKPIRTMPYPGFPTDAQPPIMAVATIAEGTTVFAENIFDNRFRHVDELIKMGADIRTEGKVAVITGVSQLHGAEVTCADLRGGAALVIAALAATGTTTVYGLHHIDRGYECLEKSLSGLGAQIQRIKD